MILLVQKEYTRLLVVSIICFIGFLFGMLRLGDHGSVFVIAVSSLIGWVCMVIYQNKRKHDSKKYSTNVLSSGHTQIPHERKFTEIRLLESGMFGFIRYRSDPL